MKKYFPAVSFLFAFCLLSQSATVGSGASGPIPYGRATSGDITVTAELDGDSTRLSSVVVRVRNNSAKPIAYAQAGVQFPGVKIGDANVVLPFTFGSVPGIETRGQQIAAPGAVVTLLASPDTVKRTEEVLRERGYRLSADKPVPVKLGVVIFTDDTALYAGLTHIRDPRNPYRWMTVGASAAPNSPVTRRPVRVGFAAPGPLAFTCQKLAGFELLFCCTTSSGNDLHVMSARFVDDPNGNATPRLATACCSGGGCCEYNEVDPCS